MKKKKRLILILIICLSAIFLWNHCRCISNVFDSIYYSRVNNIFSCVSLFNMPQVISKDRDAERYFESEGFSKIDYRAEYLEDKESCSIIVDKNKEVLFITYSYRDGDYYKYKYDVRNKLLTYQALFYNEGDIIGEKLIVDNPERKQYLFDGFLKDWFSANKYRTRFSLKHLGAYKYIEE